MAMPVTRLVARVRRWRSILPPFQWTGQAVGGVGRALLVAGQVVVDLLLVAVKLEFVVDVQDRTRRDSRIRYLPLLQQTFHHNLGPSHQHLDLSSL